MLDPEIWWEFDLTMGLCNERKGYVMKGKDNVIDIFISLCLTLIGYLTELEKYV